MSYAPSDSRGSTSAARPRMSRAWLCAKPAAVNALRAIRWYSGSMSTLVSVPPARIPRSSQMPELPQPVPISTTVLAAYGAGQEAQRRAHRRRYGFGAAQLGRVGPGRQQRLVLRHVVGGIGK